MNVKSRQLAALRYRPKLPVLKAKLQRAERVNWASMSRLYERARQEAMKHDLVTDEEKRTHIIR